MPSLWENKMRTKPPKKADAILTADWHIREDIPICRIDDFWEAQWKKIDFVADLQRRHECMVLHAGDLFHHWKPSPGLLIMTIQHLPQRFTTVLGQHDLPQHNLELQNKCGAVVLSTGGQLYLYKDGHFGMDPHFGHFTEGKTFAIWHHMVWTGKRPWPGCIEPTADAVMKKYSDRDLIVTGDNHKTFVFEKDGRLLVNPGSLTRQKSDQADHKPVVFLWYAESNTVHPIYLPIEDGVITREYIEETEERESRNEAFISKLQDGWTIGISFEENMDRWEDANHVPKSVMEIVRRGMEPL